jgi:hypothetical protein
MPPVAERLRQAYPALPERAGVGSTPANSDAQHVPSFRRWRFEMKLSLLIDIKNIESDKLKLVDDTKPFMIHRIMNKIVEELKLNVVCECSHQFDSNHSPYGVTMIYLLSESHFICSYVC